MELNSTRAEAERLLGIASKLLQGRDLTGAREFAILAQETEPLLEGSDQILAVADVLLAADKRINDHHDWYAILQLDRRCDDFELIRKQYRRLALLLHPDKNNFSFSDSAFKHVSDAWAVLSDSSKKSLYDNEFIVYSKVDLVAMKNQGGQLDQNLNFRRDLEEQQHKQQQKLPVRRGDESRLSSFWTACPYCYNLYEYPRIYEDCCLRCQNCQKAFHGVTVPSLPPFVPGREAYYCCWNFFPLSSTVSSSEGEKAASFPNITPNIPNWRPSSIPTAAQAPAPTPANGGVDGFVRLPQSYAKPSAKKRGRPKKNPLL